MGVSLVTERMTGADDMTDDEKIDNDFVQPTRFIRTKFVTQMIRDLVLLIESLDLLRNVKFK